MVGLQKYAKNRFLLHLKPNFTNEANGSNRSATTARGDKYDQRGRAPLQLPCAGAAAATVM